MASLVSSVSVAWLGAARREVRCVRRAVAVVPRSRVTRARVQAPPGVGSAHAPARTRARWASRAATPRRGEEVPAVPETASDDRSGIHPEILLLGTVLTNAAYETAAWAYDGYDGIGVPDDEATPLQNAFGAVFTIFCGWYFLRVVKKRGNRAKEFRVANTLPVRPQPPAPRTNIIQTSPPRTRTTSPTVPVDRRLTARCPHPLASPPGTSQKEEREKRDAEQIAKAKKLSASQAFAGGFTGLAIAFVLYGFTQTVVGALDSQPVPENYQARQISITVRTIVSGLAYLATFVYAANGTGLMALGAQKWLDKLTGVDLIDEAAERWAAGESAVPEDEKKEE